MPELAELLEKRLARIKRLESMPKPVPLKEHRDYGKYFTWLKEGKFTAGEISTQLLHAGLDAAVMDQDPEKPLGWKPEDELDTRPKSAPPPVTPRSRPGLGAVFSMFDQGRGSMDTRRLGACLHKLGIKYDRTLLDEATARAGQESEIPNFKGSYLGHFPLVSADFWTSDHLSERSRSVDAFSGTRARGTLTLKRR